MKFASVSELTAACRPVLDLNGGMRVKDPAALQSELIDRLVHTAVFGDADTQAAARWIIWEAGHELGIVSASILPLYQARSRGEYADRTVPAINVRAMAYDMARAVLTAAHKHHVGAFIFELARSEMEYTGQTCDEFATVVMAASIKEGHRGPIFIQGDHYQANAKRYASDPEGVVEGLRKLIRQALVAGYGNIDIDTSTLVDLSKPTVREQQRTNFERCAELAALIRDQQPAGVVVSIGGEIGEVGKKNSTVEELRAFVDGFVQHFAALGHEDKPGLAKISVNTGSTHGGVVLADGSVAKVQIDFETLRELGKAARREYHMGGVVQHGASTLPAEAFNHFPRVQTLEVHLATEFQNILFDGGAFPEDLKQEMYRYIHAQLGDEGGPNDTDEQFVYKTRKKVWGPFKAQTWNLPEETRRKLRGLLEDKLTFLYDQLGVDNSEELVAKWIVNPPRIRKPQPAALHALGV
jgi:fructose/tagatose bisphosphate aldolase